MTIGRGKPKNLGGEDLLHSQFIHPESHMKSPGIETEATH
jgi:hypothetical protein